MCGCHAERRSEGLIPPCRSREEQKWVIRLHAAHSAATFRGCWNLLTCVSFRHISVCVCVGDTVLASVLACQMPRLQPPSNYRHIKVKQTIRRREKPASRKMCRVSCCSIPPLRLSKHLSFSFPESWQSKTSFIFSISNKSYDLSR